jgi:hypothetical protein
VIPQECRSSYPELADDFAVLDEVVTPAFTRYDVEALQSQNRYRRQQVFIMGGSALITALGGVQAAFTEQRWPGLLLTLVGAVLPASTVWAKETDSQAGYLSARIKAERLRALHFRYLSRTGAYAGADRKVALRRAVLAIEAGKEPQ